jgi:hypothetical protein
VEKRARLSTLEKRRAFKGCLTSAREKEVYHPGPPVKDTTPQAAFLLDLSLPTGDETKKLDKTGTWRGRVKAKEKMIWN